jgi:calcium-dependent protein kinase
VASLLNKDPLQRPSAREALRHPWLRGGIEERFAAGGRPLSLAVVQRIQVWGWKRGTHLHPVWVGGGRGTSIK